MEDSEERGALLRGGGGGSFGYDGDDVADVPPERLGEAWMPCPCRGSVSPLFLLNFAF